MNLINFFNEFNKLKKTKRKGWVDSGIINPESVAEHSFRTALMVMFLSPENLDRDKMIRMALIHETGEIDAGDITPFDGISIKKKSEAEKNSVERVAGLINNKELPTLWEEYEKQETEESRFVKQIDVLEMIFQALEYEKSQKKNIKEERWTFWEYSDKHITNPEILKIYKELKKKREL